MQVITICRLSTPKQPSTPQLFASRAKSRRSATGRRFPPASRRHRKFHAPTAGKEFPTPSQRGGRLLRSAAWRNFPTASRMRRTPVWGLAHTPTRKKHGSSTVCSEKRKAGVAAGARSAAPLPAARCKCEARIAARLGAEFLRHESNMLHIHTQHCS
jgi:hypothetical protein